MELSLQPRGSWGEKETLITLFRSFQRASKAPVAWFLVLAEDSLLVHLRTGDFGASHAPVACRQKLLPLLTNTKRDFESWSNLQNAMSYVVMHSHDTI